jgi:hypothetical protein
MNRLARFLTATSLLVLLFPSPAAAQARFVQDRIAIGFWVDPPPEDERYAEIAEANFTCVITGFGARTPEQNARVLELCEKHGLRAIIPRGSGPAGELPDLAACWGYSLRDEPNAADFPKLREAVDGVRAARPGKLAYINLFPNYANARQLGTGTYEEHVSRFMKVVNPDVLSMDRYPLLRPDADGRGAYCQNLEVLRKEALGARIPFWNFFNTMPFGPHSDPTEAQIRWQIYTSLAYGAKGVLYFCYWTPSGGEFPRGGAILTAEGRRTRHYDEAKRINAVLKNLGPTIMKLTGMGVYRVTPNDDAAVVLKGSPIRSLEKGDYLVGAFKHSDGRRAVMLNNYHFAYSAWPTVVFDAANVVEIDPRTGEETAVLDDSPAMAGLQLSLDAGQGRLFVLP